MLDIFKGHAFSTTSLTDAINDLKYKPGRIDELGIFAASGVATTSIAIEKKGEILVIVPPTPRGGPGTTIGRVKRDLRNLRIPHFEINDAVMADEVQDVRQFGKEKAIETVMGKVAERFLTHLNSFAVTEEFARMGAVQGIIVYADGSTLNLFDEFGVTADPVINFDLKNLTVEDGTLRRTCAGIVRRVAEHLGGVPFDGIHAFCGDNFFDDLLQHPEVRETFKGWSEAQILRDGYVSPKKSAFGTFEFGGIVWENYRGAVGSKTYVGTDDCHLFPTGVPDLFKTAYAPADYVDTVNTVGQRVYARQDEMRGGKGVHLDTQMNALQYCTRPKVLMKGKRG
ncbi:major capsid protein [Brucella anthropi]|uniref:major capsid protein n=1 Tax=Brucella anthropi TaxID=529 RepID=UPI0005BBF082|nr:major capsid protein [Brucella anthropi]KIU70149.1 phage protein GP20 [Brucella anthropi]